MAAKLGFLRTPELARPSRRCSAVVMPFPMNEDWPQQNVQREQNTDHQRPRAAAKAPLPMRGREGQL